MVIEVITE